MSDLKLVRPCSVNIDDQPQTANGNFCSLCSVDVIDFRNLSPDEIKQTLLSNSNERSCGTFLSHQIEDPYHDKQEQYSKYYTQLKSKRTLSSRVLIPIILLMIFLSSCVGRRKSTVCGQFYYSLGENDIEQVDKY